jgi:peptidoglycan/LPS O-acetylase OafA/YrhL
MTRRPAPGRAYEPQLDGLRAVAVLAVAWSHWAPHHQYGIPFGAGVHLFFVLSGYLITRILLRVRQAGSRLLGLRAFYIRRLLRIFPAYYLWVAVGIVAVPYVRSTWPWHVGYLSNLLFYNQAEWAGPVSHWWSLAVEEQFYLVWPLAVLFAPGPLLLPLICVGIAIAAPFRAGLTAAGHPLAFVGILTPSVLDCLGLGSLLGLVSASPESEWRRLIGGGVLAIGAGCMASAVFWPAVSIPALSQTGVALLFTGLVWAAARQISGPIGTLLECGPMQYLGRISYGFYLSHNFAPFLLGLAHVDLPAHPRVVQLGLLFVTTLVPAALSWHLMERPLNELKRFFPYERDPAARSTPNRAVAGPSGMLG